MGIEEGTVLRGIERIELLTCAGESEKPLTTEVALFSELLLDDSMVADGFDEWAEKESFDGMAGDSYFGWMNSGILSASGAR